MNLEKKCYNILNNTGYDVYAEIAPQNKPKPFIIYNMITDNRINGINCFSDVQNSRFQIDVYTNTIEERFDIVESVKYELELGDVEYILYSTSNSNLQGEGYRATIDLKFWSK